MNLSLALGVPKEKLNTVVPLSEQKELIQERVGEGMIRLNPRVDDLAERISLVHDGIRILVMGSVVKGGGGCACPANVLLRSFLSHLMLQEKDAVILDMEAGIEHLGRSTIIGVDAALIVVEPGVRSLEVGRQIRKLADDIKIKKTLFVANKQTGADTLFESYFDPDDLLGSIPRSEALLIGDIRGEPVRIFPELEPVMAEIVGNLEKKIGDK
jgi:CO dehydrogenase maturation factor